MLFNCFEKWAKLCQMIVNIFIWNINNICSKSNISFFNKWYFNLCCCFKYFSIIISTFFTWLNTMLKKTVWLWCIMLCKYVYNPVNFLFIINVPCQMSVVQFITRVLSLNSLFTWNIACYLEKYFNKCPLQSVKLFKK